MKAPILAAMAAGALVSLAAPSLVAAQPYDHHGDYGHGGYGHGPDRPGGWDLERRIDWMQRRIDRGRDDGSLDRHEAFRVQSQLDDIRHDERRLRHRHGGWLSPGDRDMLQNRLDRLNDQIRWLRHNDDHRPW